MTSYIFQKMGPKYLLSIMKKWLSYFTYLLCNVLISIKICKNFKKTFHIHVKNTLLIKRSPKILFICCMKNNKISTLWCVKHWNTRKRSKAWQSILTIFKMTKNQKERGWIITNKLNAFYCSIKLLFFG